ncbi:major facilitator superfamily domain-containing protein [Crucibulum laeve]|uniref:Major facilitator superfamily domain-containing protein n=1 Tax=Crucibulum laeve TaxID=68775 RepID=A0A5C3LVL7_9AGAR|nr:major facilitator superfamily domain-containing protein [Crucibulum laeve]
MGKTSPVKDYEKHADTDSSIRSDSPAVVVSDVLEKRVWRKIDIWILPIATMFYLLSFLDRTNLGNARVAGLQKDLKMTNHQYSVALTVTYVPYIVAELPSNLLLKIIGPNLMLPTMLTLWGVVTTLQGVVKTYHGLLVCRFFLGLLEGGVFPGLVLYLSFFYPRQRLHLRVSAFFSAASISGAFSGLLAYGIVNMDGVGSRAGWAWIFLLEGLFTIAFGLCSFFFLPASPSKAKFLKEDEKLYVEAKLKEDGATAANEEVDAFSWREVGMAFKLPQMWMQAIIFFFGGAVLYGLAYFAPSIIQGLGYTSTRAQLMSVPPFAVAFVVNMIGACISDRYRCRGLVSIFSCSLCVIGFAMFLGSTKHSVQYGSLFFSIPGAYLGAPTVSAWSANNVTPHTRRATALAIGFIMTNTGGILATWLLGSLSPPPRYTKATITLLVFSILMTIFSGLNLCYLWDQNKKKKSIRQTISRHEEDPMLGDKSAWFEYAL